ncbi:alkylhydroperoxidase [Staphylococcus edaphicus]|uniref:Alkylhydroperoxidase n=1 Tax=Staphylococcus edaphicus TaxID=1955013 RepID=A0A2C6U3V5_9STAP|nr:alkylhydroperoxidase [Staphylococcus edaphicus]PHK48562.1 alkylhydroperoxidase [Staphylococcus edaphicus]UQW81440.1 carboxymuconolactone decarboxylase family protein [Staphylococcus edaphicus]
MALIQLSENGKTSFQKLLGYNKKMMLIWANLSDVLEKDNQLSSGLKEEMRRMLAQNNGCNYCKAKGRPSGKFTDEKSAICIGFVDVYIKLGTEIPQYILKILKDNLTESEISELFAFITFTTCQQYFGAMMKLDAEI